MKAPLSVADRYAVSFVLDFVQADLKALSVAEQQQLRANVYTLTGDMYGLTGFRRIAPLSYSKAFGADGPPEYSEEPLEPWSIVQRRHKVLKRAVSKLDQGTPCTFPFPNRVMLLPSAGRKIAEQFTGSAEDIFFYMIVKSIAKAWPQVRTCANPECARLFLRDGKMEFCSAPCSTRARYQRYAARHSKPQRKGK
jgi:hypothetical protein